MITYDIETRGHVNVVDHGLRNHAADPDLRLLVVAARVGDTTLTWHTGQEWDHMEPFLQAIERGEWLVAHNETYDRTVWNSVRHLYDLPEIKLEQSIDSAAWLRCFNMPSKLDDLAMRLLGQGKAKAPKHMWDAAKSYTEEDMEQQVLYCARDVDALVDIMALVPTPTKDFIDQYHACARMNDRGCAVDMELTEVAVRCKPLTDAGLHMPEGVKLRGPSFRRWLRDNLPDDLVPLLTVKRKKRNGYKFDEVTKLSADKSVRRALLEAMEHRTDCGNIRDMLHDFEEANRASKFPAILKIAHKGRVHDQFVFAGASQTGRAASRGIQLQNTLRTIPDDAEQIIADIKAMPFQVLSAKYEVSKILPQLVRPTLIGDLTWCDWSAIEARMLPWLSNDAEDVLDVFRAGKDIYVEQARVILGKQDISKDERQTFGKVPTLALGYQGGVAAFQAMARNYGVKITDEEADEIKQVWRKANSWATRFWHNTEDAAMSAIRGPLSLYSVGRIKYQFIPDLLRGTLLCWLPSGRFIAYPEAVVKPIERFDTVADTITFVHPTYGPSTTYGGALVQGATQAEAATLLREALVRCDSQGLRAVLQIHDEIVIEGGGPIQEIMEHVPDWATGLPLAAETEHGSRYKIKKGVVRRPRQNRKVRIC